MNEKQPFYSHAGGGWITEVEMRARSLITAQKNPASGWGGAPPGLGDMRADSLAAAMFVFRPPRCLVLAGAHFFLFALDLHLMLFIKSNYKLF